MVDERRETLNHLINIVSHLRNTGLGGYGLKTLAFQMVEGEWGGVHMGDQYNIWVDEDRAAELISDGLSSGMKSTAIAQMVLDQCFAFDLVEQPYE